MNRIFAAVSAIALSAPAFGLGPRIDPGSVKMSQPYGSDDVTIEYVLSSAPAIVTLDIVTNRTGAATGDEADWVSIGGENVQCIDGDVNMYVTEPGKHVLTWHAKESWPGHKVRGASAKAVVTAWATNSPPDYLVVDLVENNLLRYYTSTNFIPRGGLTNVYYRTSAVVMRKMAAKSVEWWMGSDPDQSLGSNGTRIFYAYSANCIRHRVVLTNDYYIGVFMLTRGQVSNFASWTGDLGTGCYRCDGVSAWTAPNYGAVYCAEGIDEPTNSAPCFGVSHAFMRGSSYVWPSSRHGVKPESWLGKARARTGVDFDLPTEAQWEFAARAGTETILYNGEFSASNQENLRAIAWFNGNRGSAVAFPVGLKMPNAFGMYDMIGNNKEICLDWYADDYGGLSNAFEPEGPATGSARVYRAHRSQYDWPYHYVAYRASDYGEGRYGARLVCPVSLKYPEGER